MISLGPALVKTVLQEPKEIIIIYVLLIGFIIEKCTLISSHFQISLGLFFVACA